MQNDCDGHRDFVETLKCNELIIRKQVTWRESPTMT